MRVAGKARQRLSLDVKLGIVKQLHKDNMISTSQYQFLIDKYRPRKGDGNNKIA